MRGATYFYDQKHGRLTIFLHSFAYPFGDFSGELVQLKLAADGAMESIDDRGAHQPVYSIELEPELLGAIFQGDWRAAPPGPAERDPAGLRRCDPGRRGPSLLRAPRDRHRAYAQGRLDRFQCGPRGAGRIDLDPAADEEFLPDQPARLASQGQGSADGVYRRAPGIRKTRFSKTTSTISTLGSAARKAFTASGRRSEYFFSKEPRDLTIAEMATIAGMISSPNRYNPMRHRGTARIRRNEVLSSMLQDGYISQAAYDSRADRADAPARTLHRDQRRAVFCRLRQA